ncbi:deoxyribodipyrimidine photo-lyase [Dyadobacter tibetensis]|uniref:deoxyribodipyrimidine photo-lyase n=1 Tax=Dyadobacter tibetensis TaxID=1211851 RepID=UPI0004712F5E|nr:deoxyribodipyrimidine photo-lyase [Dyadobacter tibetensis]
MTHRVIYWFRNDLRLQDNEAFFLAAQQAQQIIPVYVFDKRLFEPTRLGFLRTGSLRGQQIIQAVASLRNELRNRGSELLIRVGEPEIIVAEIAEHYQASFVYTSKKIGPKETRVESSLSKNLKQSNTDFKLPWIDTLTPAMALPFNIAKLPGSFSDYQKAIATLPGIGPGCAVPENLVLSADTPYEAGSLPSLLSLGVDIPLPSKAYLPQENTAFGEALAHQKLTEFVEQVTQGDWAPSPDPITDSGMSIWLSLGCLSPRQIYHAFDHLPDNHPFKELVTRCLHKRDYAQFTLLKFGPRLFKPTGIRHDFEKTWANDQDNFVKWMNGETEREDVNKVMQDLKSIGYISGEERNLAAQYLVDELKINWTWGATYFESILIDYDVAVSWGRWNNVARVGI